MEMRSTLLALYDGNILVTDGFSRQKASNIGFSYFLCFSLNNRSPSTQLLVIFEDMTPMWHLHDAMKHVIWVYCCLIIVTTEAKEVAVVRVHMSVIIVYTLYNSISSQDVSNIDCIVV